MDCESFERYLSVDSSTLQLQTALCILERPAVLLQCKTSQATSSSTPHLDKLGALRVQQESSCKHSLHQTSSTAESVIMYILVMLVCVTIRPCSCSCCYCQGYRSRTSAQGAGAYGYLQSQEAHVSALLTQYHVTAMPPVNHSQPRLKFPQLWPHALVELRYDCTSCLLC